MHVSPGCLKKKSMKIDEERKKLFNKINTNRRKSVVKQKHKLVIFFFTASINNTKVDRFTDVVCYGSWGRARVKRPLGEGAFSKH